jgi:hypothetical protein
MLVPGIGAKGPPTGGEDSGNNLSYPALYTAGTAETYLFSIPAGGGTLGVHYCYGCNKPTTVDSFSFPNTACTLDDGVTFLTAEQCTAAGAPCEGYSLDRIYFQKQAEVKWNAETEVELAPSRPTVKYLEWGDNLESTTWSTSSVIRVETQPFAVRTNDLTGFYMWHVSGHGPTEQWGARVTETGLAPRTYEAPFTIIHTALARLNIAKLSPASGACPASGSGGGPPTLALDWNPDMHRWVSIGEDPSPCLLRDTVYTAELNVGGKWVYGYNWSTRRDVLEGCDVHFEKGGWWRLTFYTNDDRVFFDPADPVFTPYASPTLPPVVDPAPTLFPLSESETGEPLYAPVVDYEHNLTYIDICLSDKTQGGGGGGKGSGGKGGGGNRP